jgi:hypothetical protein
MANCIKYNKRGQVSSRTGFAARKKLSKAIFAEKAMMYENDECGVQSDPIAGKLRRTGCSGPQEARCASDAAW